MVKDKKVDIYQSCVRPLLFQLDPESAHDFVFTLAQAGQEIPGVVSALGSVFGGWGRAESAPVETVHDFLGTSISSRCGIAAGFDKDGRILPMLEALGCPFIEVGTVTPLAQAGNPRPRIFRLAQDSALINRMGFPSRGAAFLKRRLIQFRQSSTGTMKVLVNIGKNKQTPISLAWRDYLSCFETLADTSNYFVINVSSPNTPDLRDLQTSKALREIISPILQSSLWSSGHRLLVKLSPDESDSLLEEAVRVVEDLDLAGLVLTNTTRSRPETLRSSYSQQEGGLSGAPLRLRSLECVSTARSYLGKSRTIIGVGGVFNGSDLHDLLSAGADFAEVYTAMIFRGPALFSFLANEYNSSVVKASRNE